MKKSLYIAAALMSVVGCSKSEIAPETAGTHDIKVSVAVSTGADTKAVFDGDSHIKFEKGDYFYAAVAKKETPTKGVKVAKSKGAAAGVYYSIFKIKDFEATAPVFDGELWSIVDADFANEYNFYGVFPAAAVNTAYSEEDLTSWIVKIPEEQTATQTSWYNRADIMLVKPTTISTSNKTHNDEYGEYSTVNSEKLEFAHLFGFGKISFAGVPDAYKSQVVKSVRIEAVGENKALAGRFSVDITKDVYDADVKSTSPVSYINLPGDGTTTVSDYVAWFVANNGEFDVKITVFTNKADLVFERKGLVIARSAITSPIVNYKSSDVVTSHDVALAEGETWTNTPAYSKIINSSYKERAWGDGDKKMNFSISYPGSNNGNYGTSLYTTDGYTQGLASSTIIGGKVVLSSAADFSGVKMVKANLGIYTEGVTADFTMSLVKDGKQYDLGKVNITGNGNNPDGKEYYFSGNSECESGQLVLTVDNLSNQSCRPYIGALSINPAPGIVLDSKTIKVAKTAHSESVDCGVYAATGDPTVTVADDAKSWLSASWASNKLTVTVTENTGKKRAGTITIKAKGLSETTETVTVEQASATAVTYKLSVTAADMYKVLKAEADKLKNEGKEVDPLSGYPVTAKFTAKGVNDATKTTEVEIYGDKLYIGSATETSFKSKGSIKCTSAVGAISKIVVVADKKMKAGAYDDLILKLSSDGSSWSKVSSNALSYTGDGPYTSTAVIGDDSVNWFDIAVTNWGSSTPVYSFEVTFTTD